MRKFATNSVRSVVIADSPASSEEDSRLLHDYYQLLERGTEYVRPSNIAMNLLTTKSHLNPALQIADLVIGITAAMCTSQRDHATPYWDIIKRSLYRGLSGEVMGCELKVFPNEIVEAIHMTLFPEMVEQRKDSEESYEEYIERKRHVYSVLMSEEELDMHFPRRW